MRAGLLRHGAKRKDLARWEVRWPPLEVMRYSVLPLKPYRMRKRDARLLRAETDAMKEALAALPPAPRPWWKFWA